NLMNLPALHSRGDILAFDLRGGGQQWTLDLSTLRPTRTGLPEAAPEPGKPKADSIPPVDLLLQDFGALPVLVLLGDRPVERGDLGYRQLRITCIDKATGKVLVDWLQPSTAGTFRNFNPDLLRGRLELMTYNESLTVLPRPPEPVQELEKVQ